MTELLAVSDIFMSSDPDTAETVGEGIRRIILNYDEHLMLAKVWFEKGAIGTVHNHPHSQISYIIDGKFEVMVDGHKRVLGAGSSFRAPSGADHGSVCLEAGIILDMFSPYRQDFLNPEGGK
ncbi:MAG: cupin domain-containing protein [Henriciella sp.]